MRHVRVALDTSDESTVCVCACGWRCVAISRSRAAGFYLAHQNGADIPPKLTHLSVVK